MATQVINSFPSYDFVDNKVKDSAADKTLMPRSQQQQSQQTPASTPGSTAVATTSPAPASAELNREKNRLATFVNWNVSFIDKRTLAQIGFYFIGPNDMVKCYFCRVEIGMWEPEDNALTEHIKWSPNCALLRGRETNNVPIDAEALKSVLPNISYDTCGIRIRNTSYPETAISYANAHNIHTPSSSSTSSASSRSSSLSQTPPVPSTAVPRSEPTHVFRHEHPEFLVESHRLMSFEDWPKTMKQKPKDLAEAGFYYTGKGDRVICFSCGGGLKDWEETDVPWEQHAMWYSKCDYLKLMKGQPFIDKILARKSTPPAAPGPCPGSNKDEVPAKSANSSSSSQEEERPVCDNKLCKICYETEYNTAFFPCGHIIACAKCASSVTKCPYCRQPFTNVMRVYFS